MDYPSAEWEGWQLSFSPAPVRWHYKPRYAICICIEAAGFLLVNIEGRGWVTPSGKVEADEDSESAARREVLEEAGAEMGPLRHMGCYQMARAGETRFADVWVGEVANTGMPTEGETRVVPLSELPTLYTGWNPLFERLFTESRYCLSQG